MRQIKKNYCDADCDSSRSQTSLQVSFVCAKGIGNDALQWDILFYG